MYTRNYYPEEPQLTIPEHYDGYAFSEEKKETTANKECEEDVKVPLSAPWDTHSEPTEEKAEKASAIPKTYENAWSGFVGRFPFLKNLGKFDFLKKGFSDFGTEELIIIGVALFLLFSKK